MKKRLFALLLALCMTLSLLPIGASAAEIVASGTCKNNLTWKLDSDGVLTISGQGEMIPEERDSENLTWRARELYRTITSVVIESGVTSIMTDAFNSCDHIQRVSISESVTSIGDSAFKDCKSLSTIMIPKSVTSIGNDAFDGSGLTGITVPSSVTHLGWGLFEACESLTSATISNGAKAISDNMFSCCSKLKTVSIPESVTKIGDAAFEDCKSLTSVKIPDGVTSIGARAFMGCSKLTSVTIPKGVTDIQESTFENCARLASVTIPDSVVNIGEDAFRNCGSLTHVAIPKNVKNIGSEVFFGCGQLQSIDVSQNNAHYSSIDGCLLTSDLEELICVPEGTTGAYAIPDSVKCIQEKALIGCSGLTSIKIPDGVRGIREYAFFGCSRLEKVSIPENVEYIGMHAFSGCSGLENISIPGSVEYIGECAFAECSGLVRAAIGTGLNAVGSDVFSGCKRLRDVLFAGKKTDWRFERDGEWEDGTTALGLSNQVRIHYNVQDPENHIREKTPASGSTPARYVCDCGYEFSDPRVPEIPVSETGIPSALPADYGIVSGDGTRYGFMHLLWIIAGSPKPTSTDNPFTDITKEMVPTVLWAVEEGITSGTSETTFSPDLPCTRGQIVTFLWRFAGKPAPAITKSPFADAEPSVYWYKPLLWAYESGAVEFEESQTLFEPNQKVISVSFDPQTAVFRLDSELPQAPEETPAIDFSGMTDDNGNLTIDSCYVPSSVPMPEMLVVPETVRGYKVVALDSHAFEDLGTLKTLYLPLSLREVFNFAFPSSLKTIYYAGCSEAQWNRIVFHSVDLSGITIHYRAHSWDAGTLDDNGVRHYTCTSCGETMTAVEKKADSGVKVLAEPKQAAPLKDAKLVAKKNTDETKAASNVVVKSVSGAEKTQAYDIRLEDEQGKTVQPKSSVTVVIPLPKDWDPNEIAVYYVDPKTGKTENMKAVASSDGKTVSFQTTHFSCYVLTQIKTTKQTAKNPFKDVKSGAYYYDPVLWAVNHDPQITNGTGKDTFSPEGTCTRAQVVTFLWRAAGCPEPTSTKNPFKDVSKDAYYYKAVLWAVEKGITNGTGKDTFSPNAGCTRGQVVTFQYRTNGSPKVEATNPFKDVSKGQYYYDAVLWAVKNEITKGTDTTHFSPNSTCTRGQIVTFLYRDMA